MAPKAGSPAGLCDNSILSQPTQPRGWAGLRRRRGLAGACPALTGARRRLFTPAPRARRHPARRSTQMTFFLSAAFGLFGAIITWVFLPDTTGLSLDELDRLHKYMLTEEVRCLRRAPPPCICARAAPAFAAPPADASPRRPRPASPLRAARHRRAPAPAAPLRRAWHPLPGGCRRLLPSF
ncbi:MAG: hypothetical protein J3K34DRAFT_18397 [Monoraphidium minutum]|nr:MAG: hypothetical protein J3K34DRAFT_18397 [Monoraphidium minutum]